MRKLDVIKESISNILNEAGLQGTLRRLDATRKMGAGAQKVQNEVVPGTLLYRVAQGVEDQANKKAGILVARATGGLLRTPSGEMLPAGKVGRIATRREGTGLLKRDIVLHPGGRTERQDTSTPLPRAKTTEPSPTQGMYQNPSVGWSQDELRMHARGERQNPTLNVVRPTGKIGSELSTEVRTITPDQLVRKDPLAGKSPGTMLALQALKRSIG